VDQVMVQTIELIASSFKERQIFPGTTKDIFDQLFVQYRSLIAYKEFKSEILQSFREIGNAIVVTQIIDEHMV
jgi:Cytoplasmic Fragile-X interacting family